MAEPNTPHVLVVDAAAALRGILGSVLQQAGFRVTLASGVREGVQALEMGRPELVVTDLSMPDGSGHDILLAANQFAPPPPVIVVSGSLSESGGDGHELLEAGARHLVPKPFVFAELLAIVHSMVAL